MSIFTPTARGLRVVAVYEAAKGALVLFVGFGLLSLVHERAQELGEQLIRHSHLNPASRFPRIFLELLAKTSDARLHLFGLCAVAYALARFVEGWGLWNDRRWAEWIAVVSTALYVPIEIYELCAEASWLKLAVLFVNAVVLLYLVMALRRHRQQPNRRDAQVAS